MVSMMEGAMLAVALVVFVITVAIGGDILSSLKTTQLSQTASCIANPTWVNCTTTASNATTGGLAGITNIATQSGTIGTILGAVIIIGLLMGAFAMRK